MSLKGLPNEQLLTTYSEWLVCQRYSRATQDAYNRVMRKFLRFWGQRRFSGVGPLDIHEFLTESSRRDLSSEVVHRHLWALRSFFDFLCLRGVVDEVAPRFVRPRPTRRRVLKALSQINIRRLIDAATNARDRAILELFYATGCRLGELVNIRLEHVDFARQRILVQGKTGGRRVYFGLTAKRILRKYLNGRKTGYLFESRYLVQKGCVSWNGYHWIGNWLDYSDGTGIPARRAIKLGPLSLGLTRAWAKFRKLVPNPDQGHVRRKPNQITRTCIAEIFKEAAGRTGLGRVTSNNLRHSFAAHLLDNGADIRPVQELMGRSSLMTTNCYANIASVPLSRAYKKFHPRS